MRLALKFALVFMLANIVLAAVYGYVAKRRAEDFFQREVCREAQEMEPLIERQLCDADIRNPDVEVPKRLRQLFGEEPQSMQVHWVRWDATASELRPMIPVVLETDPAIQEHRPLMTAGPDGATYLVIYWRVSPPTGPQGIFEFVHSTSDLVSDQWHLYQHVGLLILGMAVISCLLAVALGVRLVGRPLQTLIAKARLISIGNLEGPVRIRSHDELEELADSLNAMCTSLAESQRQLREETTARIAAIEQLRHADRLKTVGRLASGIAHELGTPLNVVAGRATLIGSGRLDAEEVTQSAAAIRTEADRMTRIIRQLLDFARASTPRKQPIDLRSVVRQTIDLLNSIAEKQKVRLSFGPTTDAAVAEIDAGQIQQVLTNLTMNAIQAMPQGGPVEFRIDRRTCRHPDNGGTPGEFFTVEIRDCGVGIPEEHIRQLFEPFFTTKEVGAGTGLGLSIAYGIVQEHGGWIDVASQVGQGSCFTIYLPAGGDCPDFCGHQAQHGRKNGTVPFDATGEQL